MSRNIDKIIKYWVKQNNQNLKIAFPAKIVGTAKLKDGLVDVKPMVSHINPINSQVVEYPTIYDVRLIFPSTKKSTICFPVDQGDFVELIIQSSEIQKFVNGNEEYHSPSFASFNNLNNIVAIVGFSPYSHSCFNSTNYINEFDLDDLNIVHNKGTKNEASIHIKVDGSVEIKSDSRLDIDTKNIDAKEAVIITDGDVIIEGRSVKDFMKFYDKHTHIGNSGSPTSPPQGI